MSHEAKSQAEDGTSSIPPYVADKLNALCIDRRSPAFLHIDETGAVVEEGGDCGKYGFGGLQPDSPVGHQLDYLEGILPLDGDQLFLPLVHVVRDVYADIHLFPGPAGDWVLYLDATPDARRAFQVQQNTNELSLLRRDQTKMLARTQQSHADLLSILNQLEVITAIIDEHGFIEFWSDSGVRLLSVDDTAAKGRRWDEVLPLVDDGKARIDKLIQDPPTTPKRVPVRAQTRHGRQFLLEIDVRNDPREPGKRILYMYDTSEVYDLRQLLQEKASFENIVGKTDQVTHVFQLISDVAKVDATVLIEGETGTGKELVARAIHNTSSRRDMPLIVVNSAGLSDTLIDSQLFGHKKGAFTDASADQEGFFEAAEGGTIFLDEIGDVPMNTQTRILRALEQKEVVRIGDTHSRKVDVRILAATNKDLDTEVKSGNFRLDLLYRLRVARIQLPTLRERIDDIPLLVDVFIDQARAATGNNIEQIDQNAMHMLVNYAWPGNVRELKNAISSAAIHCKGPVIREKDLPPEITGAPEHPTMRRDYQVQSERERILKALETAKGKRGEAAKILGIGRATLYRRMKACMINPSDLPKGANWLSG